MSGSLYRVVCRAVVEMFKTLKRRLSGSSPSSVSSGLDNNRRYSLAPASSQFGSLLAPPPTQYGAVLAPTLRHARSFHDLADVGPEKEGKVCAVRL